jgi:hypothetical protein
VYARKDRMPGVPRTVAPNRRGVPTRTLSQPLPRTGWHAPHGHAPDALAQQPRQHLSPPEAWQPRGDAVRRVHDARPPVDEVCLALTWVVLSLLLAWLHFVLPHRGCRAREQSLFGAPTCSAIHWSRRQSSTNPISAKPGSTLSPNVRLAVFAAHDVPPHSRLEALAAPDALGRQLRPNTPSVGTRPRRDLHIAVHMYDAMPRLN